jgi:TP901 family phage tail tape measure protein
MASMNDLVVSIGADIGNLRKDMKRMEMVVSRSSKRIGRSLGAAFKLSHLTTLTRNLAAMGRTAVAALSGPIKAFAEFDTTLRMAMVRAGGMRGHFERMKAMALDLGSTTSFTATQVAESMMQLATAGFNTDEIEAMQSPILSLARATGTDLPNAAQVAASLIRQFQLDAKETTRVVDTMTFASNNSMLTVEKLGEAFRIFGPAASAMGVSLEESAAAAMLLANTGAAASTIGTGLRRVLNTTVADAEALGKVFKGANFLQDGNFIGLIAALQEMNRSMDQMALTGTQRVSKLKEAYSLLGVTAGTVLTGSTDEILDNFKRMTAGIEGMTARSARTIDAGIGGAINRLTSAWDGFQKLVLTQFETPLIEAFEYLTEKLKGLEPLIVPMATKVRLIFVDMVAWIQAARRHVPQAVTHAVKALADGFDVATKKVSDGLIYLFKVTLPPIVKTLISDAGQQAAYALLEKAGPRRQVTRKTDLAVQAEHASAIARHEASMRGENGGFLGIFKNKLKTPYQAFVEDLAETREKFRSGTLLKIVKEAAAKAAAIAESRRKMYEDAPPARVIPWHEMIQWLPVFKKVTKKATPPAEVHGFGGGGAEQLGSAAAYKKVFDYFTGRKQNKADQERNKILKKIQENTKPEKDPVAGMEGEI